MQEKPLRATVVGTGYVGLVTGACLASPDVHVVGHDIDQSRLAALEQGNVPFHEPGLGEVVTAATAAGWLSFTADVKTAAVDADVLFLAVGTPPRDDGTADLTALHGALDGILPHLGHGAIVATRSTVPPGTGDELQARVNDAGRSDVRLVSVPEFLAEGTAVKDFMLPSRLVFGGEPEATAKVAALFSGLGDAPRIHVDRTSAEMAKYAANAFLAARVSLVNEIADLCDATGADVRNVSKIVGLDPRIGALFLRPGLGYGGSCFPKDVQALAAVATRLGVPANVLRATEVTNADQGALMANRAAEMAASGCKIAVLGIAFKPGTDDTRCAPGPVLAARLAQRGFQVVAFDPVATLPGDAVDAGVRQVASAEEALAGAGLAVVATEWPEFRELAWPDAAMAAKNVLDTRNCLDGDKLRGAGFTYRGVGIP